MPISRRDAQKLWGLAGACCSFDGCQKELAWSDKDGLVGEMAHIVAASEDGPRGKSPLTAKERDSYANRILLCPDHHTLIDKDEVEWTVEKLHAMKEAHEASMRVRRLKGSLWHPHIEPATLHYLNIPRLMLDPTAHAMREYVDSHRLDDVTNLHDLGFRLGSIMLAFERFLVDWKPCVLNLTNIDEANIGARIQFETEFRTKNVPGPDQLTSFRLTKDLKRNPHLYCKVRERTVYFSLNPRWITADSSFIWLNRGRVSLSGIGILNVVEAKEACITPLVLGLPDYEGSVFFHGRKFGEGAEEGGL